MITSFHRVMPAYRRGFTLVEVALALGISTFGIFAVIGLLPLSLRYARESMELSQKARAVQKISFELLQMQFSELTDAANANREWYYDFNGVELSSSTDPKVYYRVRTEITPSLIAAENTGTGLNLSNIVRVTVNITTPEENATGTPQVSRTVLTIPNTGY